MEISFDTVPILFISGIAVFGVYYLLYKRFIYSIIDPLLFWLIFTSFGTVLSIEIIPETCDLIHFMCCQFFLWIGFLISYKPYSGKHNFHSNEKLYHLSNIGFLRKSTYLFCLLYIISNIIIAYNKGFALLSDTPTESKISDFQNGFGFFRKLNWTIGTFSTISSFFLYLKYKQARYLILFCILSLFGIMDGSKAALLKIVISVGLLVYHPYFNRDTNFIKKFSRYSPLIAMVSLSVSYIVLYKENTSSNEILAAFVRRLLFSADSILFYYQPINIDFFKNYGFSDYVTRITNPVLGFLRIQEYEEAIGNIMVDNLRPPGSSDYVTVGPNAPFYIESRIYFNYWIAFPYSTLIGFLYSRLRTYYFSINNTDAFHFIYSATSLQLLDAIIVDTNLAVVQIFGMFTYVYIPYLILKLLLTKRLRFRLPTWQVRA